MRSPPDAERRPVAGAPTETLNPSTEPATQSTATSWALDGNTRWLLNAYRGEDWSPAALRMVAIARVQPELLTPEASEALAEGDRLHPGDPRRYLAVDIGPDPVDVDEETTEAFDRLVRDTGDRQGQGVGQSHVAPDQGEHTDRDRRDSRDRRTSWTAAELLACEFPEPRWAVEGLVPEGLGFLVGAPKVGKSWLGLGLGVSVAAGGMALGRIEVEQGPALFLGLEDTPRRLQDRLRKILADAAAPADLTVAVECEPIEMGGRERVWRWLDDHPQARLVVIDVLARVRGPRLQGESLYAADYRAAAAIKTLADESGVPFLVLHHPRKMGAEDFVDQVSGTAGLAGAADSISMLKRTRGKADGILSITGRDVDEAEYALRFAPDLGAWQLTDTPVVELRRTDTENAIIAWLADNEGRGPMAVAEGTDLDYETVKKAMRRAAKRGYLDSDGHGRYWVPIRGDQ